MVCDVIGTLRPAVRALGSTAASSGKPVPVPKQWMKAAKWMEQTELAVFTNRNELVLSEDALEIKTHLRRPELVQDCEDRSSQSLWGMKRQLEKLGWKSDSTCPSIETQTFHASNQCRMYFQILLDSSLGINLASV